MGLMYNKLMTYQLKQTYLRHRHMFASHAHIDEQQLLKVEKITFLFVSHSHFFLTIFSWLILILIFSSILIVIIINYH